MDKMETETDVDGSKCNADMDCEQIQLELSTQISQYSMNPNKDPLKIVTVGKGFVGKSTLINNFLNLPTEQAANARKSQRPVTTRVTEYKNTIHSVPVHIYDTPGLQDSRIDKASVIKELRHKTGDSIDVLFYVASLNNRLDMSDEQIIELLTNEFTPRIWKHAIFVLSFADQHCQVPNYIEYTDESAEVIQDYVCKQDGCENLVVKCIRTMDDRLPIMHDNNVIAAIPTGLLENGDPKNWMSNLLVEVLRKTNKKKHIPILLCTSSIVGDLAVGGLSGAFGSVAGGMIASAAGSTTVVSTTFMGITVGVKTAAALNAVAGIVGSTATKTVAIPIAAPAGAIGLGVVGGAAIAVVVGLGFKKYIWPIIKEKLNESEETKKNQ